MAFVEAGNKILLGTAQGLNELAVAVMTASLIECPIETGTLRGSSQIEPPVKTPDKVSITMGYGYGFTINPETRHPASEYAVPVHERTEAHHKPPTKAKFLEDPVLSYSFIMGPVLKASIQQILLDRSRISMLRIGHISDGAIDYQNVATPFMGIPNV